MTTTNDQHTEHLAAAEPQETMKIGLLGGRLSSRTTPEAVRRLKGVGATVDTVQQN